jgi:hypothetical protein
LGLGGPICEARERPGNRQKYYCFVDVQVLGAESRKAVPDFPGRGRPEGVEA